jgi:farnesyl-diphosphate farnesyltransferase
MTIGERTELLGPLLRDVSRSFYLTLRVLPAEIRPQISVAYLLARATDTIADASTVATAQRIKTLRDFSEGRLLSGDVGAGDATASESELLKRLPSVLECLATFSEDDQKLIRQLLCTIVAGQIFDLERFPGKPLSDDELDRYTYLVAGCVGEFWTRICAAHLETKLDETAGVRFGKGLQLVNILRDMPRDLRNGRCYLPVCDSTGLMNATNFAGIQPIYDRWLDTAVAHLDAGWQYTLSIPAKMTRLRLACIWPIWIGLQTIARLRHANPLDAAQRVKVSRTEVYWIMLVSFLPCRNDAVLDVKYQRFREQAVERATRRVAPTGAARP